MNDVPQRRLRQALSFVGHTSPWHRAWDLLSSICDVHRAVTTLLVLPSGNEVGGKSQVLRVLLPSADDVSLLVKSSPG